MLQSMMHNKITMIIILKFNPFLFVQYKHKMIILQHCNKIKKKQKIKNKQTINNVIVIFFKLIFKHKIFLIFLLLKNKKDKSVSIDAN